MRPYQLVRAHWPQLADLHLVQPRSNRIRTAAMCSLLKNSSWPMLMKLHLSGAGSASTAAILDAFSLASWHVLEQLVSECTESDVSTINSLANVGWPLLKGFSSVGA